MKQIIMFCISALSLFASCSDEIEDTDNALTGNGQEQVTDMESLTAVLAEGLYDNWNAGDRLMLAHDGKTVSVEILESGSRSGLSGTIEGTFTDSNPLYGIYPADNMVSFDNESVTVSVPSVQTAMNGGFDEKAAVSVARSVSDSLCFQSVCGGIKLNFQMSGVTKVELESVDAYALSGKAKLKWDEQGVPVIAEMSDTDYILTFNAPDESGFLSGKDYFISTLP